MSIPASELSNTLASVVERTGRSIVRVAGGWRRAGSGVVYAPGVVVTASHVLPKDEGIRIGLADEEWDARLIGRDPSTDLAVLELAGSAPAATFGELTGLAVGHIVLMLGRPGRTVRATSGIVSALGDRPWRTGAGGELSRYLETDAPHVPGFSGGALVGLDGSVLGINTTGLLRGVSLTVPADTVRRVVDQLRARGRIRQSYLGVRSQPVRLPDAVRAQTGEEIGLVVLGVEPNGPAAKAGIQYGDTILRLGPDDVRDLGDLQAFLRADHVGETVPVKLYRAGQVVDLTLTLGERP